MQTYHLQMMMDLTNNWPNSATVHQQSRNRESACRVSMTAGVAPVRPLLAGMLTTLYLLVLTRFYTCQLLLDQLVSWIRAPNSCSHDPDH
jgi:hypothetical protein